MQGFLNDSNRMTPYRNVKEPKWPNAFWQQLSAGLSGEEPPANTLAKEHPIATTTGYLGRRLAIDPLKYLGDVVGKYRDTGKISTGDAAGFALYGLGMGYPGGAPAGEEATVGAINQASLPFKPQLQTALENRALGKTYLGANPKGKVLAETLDRIGNNSIKDELAFSGAKGDMLSRAGRIGGDTGYKALADKVEDFGKNLRRTELTNLDTEYIDFSNFRSPHTHNYREVLYHHKDSPEFSAPHFSGTKIPSPSGGQLHPIKRMYEDLDEKVATEGDHLYIRNMRKSLDNLSKYGKTYEEATANREIEQAKKMLEESKGNIREHSRAYNYVSDAIDLRKAIHTQNPIAFKFGQEVVRLGKDLADTERMLDVAKGRLSKVKPPYGKDYTESAAYNYNQLLADLKKWEDAVEVARGRYTEGKTVYNKKLEESIKARANKGLMMHRRMGDIEHEGKNVSILEELQSDWRVKGDRQGFRNEREKYKKLAEGTNEKLNEFRKKTKKLTDEYAAAGSLQDRHEIMKRIRELDKDKSRLLSSGVKQINKSHGDVPPMPYKEDWWKIMVNDSLDEAIKKGKDELWITTGEAQAKRNAPTASAGYKRLYNKDMLKYLKKRYNIVPERVERQGLDYWRIPLDRIKEDMLLHMTKSQQLKGWRAV